MHSTPSPAHTTKLLHAAQWALTGFGLFYLVGSTEKNMKTIVEGLILTIFICMGLPWLASTPAQADEPSSPIKALRDEFACPTHARRVAGQPNSSVPQRASLTCFT